MRKLLIAGLFVVLVFSAALAGPGVHYGQGEAREGTTDSPERYITEIEWGWEALEADIKQSLGKIKSTVQTFQHVAATLAKALLRTLQTLLVSIGKLVIHLTITLLSALLNSLV